MAVPPPRIGGPVRPKTSNMHMPALHAQIRPVTCKVCSPVSEPLSTIYQVMHMFHRLGILKLKFEHR